ncbi:MAG: PIG-L family deacetylase [Anaerolineae bacterium]|nr:PIG-L family deacetylase [Anaerolineae bacterium]MCI0608444.1 PIG-L family deacetylase [Anaerolineae bacterium]
MNDPLKLLAVFPHPDDETLGLGPTLARYSAEGVETYLVCATRGERGWFESEGSNPGLEGVARIREAELSCAAGHLGLREVNFLDYIDGDVDQANPEEIIGRIVAHIRRIRPHVVVTFAPDGNYGHPDHIALSQFAAGALVCAADQNFIDADRQSAHRVLKLYYMVDSVDVVSIANEAFGGISMEVDGMTRHHIGWEDWQITTRLDNSKYMDVVQKAMLCYKSQLPGYGPISGWPLDELAKVFGTGNFYRAYSLVNGGRKVETDLFEGLR